MKEKKWPHFIAVTALLIFVLLGIGSTASYPSGTSYPYEGDRYDITPAIKDFVVVGIVFVKSQEIVYSKKERSGSKITHEMFMREAAKLNADDVINIKIDVLEKIENRFFPSRRGSRGRQTEAKVTTYSYTGVGLAIKYTNAVR
ncbi:MAG: hypothetical protein FWD26_07595 [Treponema sp.]|nr:hypothetical protein [Treponema sp.]